MKDLKLTNIEEYEEYLLSNPDEWKELDMLCRVTISRFYRDRGVFEDITTHVFPELAQSILQGGDCISCLSAGCGSGEEPYSLKIIWELVIRRHLFKRLELHIIAVDIDAGLIERARKGVYSPTSLKDLPLEYRAQAFEPAPGGYILKERHKQGIEFVQGDIRHGHISGGPFDLVLCRNLAFTYFDDETQANVLDKLMRVLNPGGFFVIGIHERLPPNTQGLIKFGSSKCIYRRPPA